jgi:hypothetical protein
VADGIRTRDHRDHNPGLYQLSYGHLAAVSIPAAQKRYEWPRLMKKPCPLRFVQRRPADFDVHVKRS